MSNIETIAGRLSEETGIHAHAMKAWLTNDSFSGYDLRAITDEIHAGQSIPADESPLVVWNTKGILSDADLELINEYA